MNTVTSLRTVTKNVKSLAEAALQDTGGLLRLAPNWVPRSFCIPGRRLKLHPDDLYAFGAHRGGIDERWLSSTTRADNGPETLPDEGLSYLQADGSKVLLKKLGKVAGGAKSGTIEAWFEWVAADTPLLEEHRTMTFYDNPTLRIMDFDLDMKALQKVKFGDTKEGTFAIRIAAGLEEPQKRSPASPKRTGKMTSAEGKEGEANIWGKRSPWVDYAGELEGEKLGIAIFDHPKNPRHPTYWHSRSYGLFAANPFGIHDFEKKEAGTGNLTIPAGKTLTFKYRFYIHEGDETQAGVAARYQQYVSGH